MGAIRSYGIGGPITRGSGQAASPVSRLTSRTVLAEAAPTAAVAHPAAAATAAATAGAARPPSPSPPHSSTQPHLSTAGGASLHFTHTQSHIYPQPSPRLCPTPTHGNPCAICSQLPHAVVITAAALLGPGARMDIPIHQGIMSTGSNPITLRAALLQIRLRRQPRD